MTDSAQLFRPHLVAIVELSRPTQITFYGITGGSRRYTVALPDDIASWSEDDQLRLVKQAAMENFARNNGQTMFLGRILGYAYFRDPGAKPIRLTTGGDLDRNEEPFHVAGPGSITIGGRDLNGYFSK